VGERINMSAEIKRYGIAIMYVGGGIDPLYFDTKEEREGEITRLLTNDNKYIGPRSRCEVNDTIIFLDMVCRIKRFYNY